MFLKRASGWRQTAEMVASDSVARNSFGTDVAISGTTLFVGAYERVYVFTRTVAGWKQTAELKASDDSAGDFFGESGVAVSGTTVVVGASGHGDYAGRAYVFTKTKDVWEETAELVGPDTVAGDWFGSSVAISGKTAIVGATGYAKIAGRAELKGSDTRSGDYFGSSVAISGKIAIGGTSHVVRSGSRYLPHDLA